VTVISLHRISLKRLSLSALVAVAISLSMAPASHADTITLDFETGPALDTAINDDYKLSHFTFFRREDAGFRPYRKSVPGLAHSGNVVADVSPAHCYPGEVDDAGSCEFPTSSTLGRLTRTASSITLYAGLSQPAFGPVFARLVARNSSDAIVGQSTPVPVDVGFDTPITVSSANPDIASFELAFDPPNGAALGFDDLTMEFPAGTVADVALSGPLDTQVVLQGSTRDVPITLNRINGSDGNVTLSASGLPAGVSAQFLPNPVPGTQTGAIMRLSATDDAPTFFAPVAVTVKAESIPPDGSVLPEPRTTTVPVSVRSAFGLARASPAPVALPHCAPVDADLRLERAFDFASSSSIALAAEGLPAGVSAQFVPSATVPPGGGLIAEPKLRLRRGAGPIPAGSSVLVRASAPGYPERTLTVPLTSAAPAATLDSTTISGAVPSRLQPGSLVRLNGNGFCPGTKLRVGNALAETAAELDPSGTALSFRVPRLATSGPVTVVPPAPASPYSSTNQFAVRSFRNFSGFQFNNPGWGNLSLGEMADLVGVKEMFVSENPCWPFYDCTIVTPIPNPIAFLKWQIIEQIVQESGGHCFGINRTVQELGAGRIKLRDFASGVTKAFDLPSASGPNGALGSYLDHRHAGQTTKEFLIAYGVRSDSISTQLARLRSELEAHRVPGVVVKKSFTEGHVMTAHDIETLADGTTVIHLYDNEKEFLPAENSDTSGVTHRNREDASRIVIDPAKTRWEYTGGGWSGGNDGSFYVTKLSDWPADPSLPDVASAVIGIFGSNGGAAVPKAEPKGREILPVLDRNAPPGAGGFVLPDKGRQSLGLTMTGRKEGRYAQMIVGNGFVGAVQDVRTAKGVVDRVSGSAQSRSIEFAGSSTRPVELRLGSQTGGVSRLATIRTRSFRGGSDTAALRRGSALVYEHDGPATRFSVVLENVEKNAGAARFTSAPLRIRRGQRVRLEPASWRSLRHARLVIRNPDGTRRVRRLRSRSSGVPTRITIRRLGVATQRRRTIARVTAGLAKVPPRSAGGVVFRLLRGGKLVAKHGFGIRQVRTGKRTVSWRLPKGLRRGRYRLIADVTVISAGDRTGSARARRSTRLRLG
jgi:hypothetical protein